jgi:hypothetical protein
VPQIDGEPELRRNAGHGAYSPKQAQGKAEARREAKTKAAKLCGALRTHGAPATNQPQVDLPSRRARTARRAARRDQGPCAGKVSTLTSGNGTGLAGHIQGGGDAGSKSQFGVQPLK